MSFIEYDIAEICFAINVFLRKGYEKTKKCEKLEKTSRKNKEINEKKNVQRQR